MSFAGSKVIGIPYVSAVSSFGGVADGRVDVRLGIHTSFSADMLGNMAEFLLSPLAGLEGFDALGPEITVELIQKIKEYDLGGLRVQLADALPLVGGDSILASVNRFYDWQYSKLREAFVQLVEADLTYNRANWSIEAGDKFLYDDEDGLWIAPADYNLVAWIVLYDTKTISLWTADVVDLYLTFVRSDLCTRSNLLPLVGQRQHVSSFVKDGLSWGLYGLENVVQQEWSIGSWVYEKYSGHEWYFPCGVSPRLFRALKGIVNPPGVPHWWAYLEPPIDGDSVGLDGSYSINNTQLDPPDGWVEDFGNYVLPGQGNMVYPVDRYHNIIIAEWRGRTWHQEHQALLRVNVGFSDVVICPDEDLSSGVGGHPTPIPPIFPVLLADAMGISPCVAAVWPYGGLVFLNEMLVFDDEYVLFS